MDRTDGLKIRSIVFLFFLDSSGTIVPCGTGCPCPDFEAARSCLVARADRAITLPCSCRLRNRRAGPRPVRSGSCPVRSSVLLLS